MENRKHQQPIPEELKDEQLDAVAGGHDLTDPTTDMADAVARGAYKDTFNTIQDLLNNNLELAEDAANRSVPQPPEIQLRPFEVQSWEGQSIKSSESTLWTKK